MKLSPISFLAQKNIEIFKKVATNPIVFRGKIETDSTKETIKYGYNLPNDTVCFEYKTSDNFLKAREGRTFCGQSDALRKKQADDNAEEEKINKKLKIIRNKYNAKLLNFEKNIMVSVGELEKLGYGNEKILTKLVEEEKIKGTITQRKKPDGSISKTVKVDVSDKETASTLLSIKRMRYLDLKTLCEIHKINKSEIEDAIIKNKITATNESIFIGEQTDLYIDVKNKKNAEAINAIIKKRIQKNKLLKDKKAEEQERELEKSRTRKSARMKLIWHFCPKTKESAGEAFGKHNSELDRARKNRKKIEKMLEDATGIEESEVLKTALKDAKKEEKIIYNKICKSFWEKEGTDEFNEGMAKAREIIEQAKTQGISTIEDKKAQEYLVEILGEEYMTVTQKPKNEFFYGFEY